MAAAAAEGAVTNRSAGHRVLAVPVPALDEVVRRRTAFYDASFVSDDPDFIHAHITLLAPWVQAPTARDLETVAAIAAAASPADVSLTRVAAFPDGGVIHVAPEPDEPFRALTRALVEAFPQCPPYEGAFPDPDPHLTLDHPAGGVTVADVEERLAGVLPVTFRLDRIDLQWWANHDCRRLQTWRIGTTG